MDGKKRIARLRNAEKWKALGFAGPPQKKERKAAEWKIAQIDPAAIELKFKAQRDAIIKKFKPVGLNGPCKLDQDNLTWHRDEEGGYVRIPRGTSVFTSSRLFANWLTKRGYKLLGSGAYSSVYAKEGQDRVIKVQHGNDNWIDYCKWAAEKGFAGKFAPRVYSFKRFTNFAVAVMEKMDRTTNDKKDDLALVESLLYPMARGNLMARLYLDDLVPGSVPFFDGLFTDFKDQLDLYGKNIMIRKDGSLCVTDPVCGRSKLTSVKRLRTGDLSPRSLWIYYEILAY